MPGAAGSHLYSRPVSVPIPLPDDLAARLAAALDPEGKVGRALDALSWPDGLGDRDVLVLDGIGSRVAADLETFGARVAHAASAAATAELPAESVDVVVGLWTSFRGVDAAERAAAERLLRPGGRLLVVHHYGRDDVGRLLADHAEFDAWSQKRGPFLAAGFRVRVIHCWWEFADLDAAGAFLADAFGPEGAAVAAGLTRPRVAWNVAIYHRDRRDTGA